MNDVDYQAVYSRKLSQRGEARYIIINVTTGEILDDAQGFGYKSKKKLMPGIIIKEIMPKKKIKIRQLNTGYIVIQNFAMN